jgi:uncharacterized membrane protein YphA (DoxX/SURF4 family)
MTLLRAAARTMLASYFVVSGVKALRDPAPLVPAAEPLADKFVPLVKQYAPEQFANLIPEDAATLVRVNGAAQVLGGLALATGKGRRLGALLLAGSILPSTIAKHPFWTRTDPDEKALDRAHFLKNISLLGGVLLASADTEGKPSLSYRAHKGGESLAKDAKKARKSLTRGASHLGKDTSHLADEALAGGAALVGAVVSSSRAARKKAAKELKHAREVAAKQAAEAKVAAAKAAKQAQREARKQIKVAKKKAKNVSRNIKLGEN